MTEVASAVPSLAREDGSDALKGVQEHVFVSRDTLADRDDKVINAVEPETVEATKEAEHIITASQDVAIKDPASDNKLKEEQEVTQADEPTATKILVVEEESEDPMLEPTSETAPIVNVEAEDASQEHDAKVVFEIVSDAATKEATAGAATQEEKVDSVEGLTEAYEVEHAHENDEVIVVMPGDEEIKAAIPELQSGNDAEEIEAEAEATSAEPDNNPSANTQASSESSMESPGSIPTETGGTPSVAPEEQSTPLIPEEFEGNVKVNEPEVSTGPEETEMPETEPEALLPASNVPAVSSDDTEAVENVVLQTGPSEALVETVSIEAEHEGKTQEVENTFSDTAGPEEQSEELARAVTDSSEIVAQSEGGEVAQTLEVDVPGDNEEYTEAVDGNSSAPLLSEQHGESVIPGLSVDTTEAPERPRSPWTPSYLITTQGSSPVHPEEPEVNTATEDIADISPAAVEPEASVRPADVEVQATEDLPVPEEVGHVDANIVAEALMSENANTEQTGLAVEATEVKDELEQEGLERIPWSDPIDEAPTAVESKETLLLTLSLNTSVPRTPERPKSPWTPSYSVTQQGPGVPEPEEFVLDTEVAGNAGDGLDSHEPHEHDTGEEIFPSAPRDVAVASDIPKSTLDIERPKSPYPAAYSVHQMGPDLAEDSLPASPISGDAAESVVLSNEPEVPSSPRSELGMVTPGFDSRSEVSEASHRPNAPSSPRTDPEATSLKEVEVKTPLVLSSAEEGAPISPFQTPLVLPGNIVEETVNDIGKQETAELLTESTISGINADVQTDRRSATTGSWVKETDMERESYEESLVSPPEASPISDGTSEAVFIETAVPRETATSNVPISTTDLAIPKLDVTVAPLLAPPVVVTNTMSTDSAYTQISDTLSPSQETCTNVTTPDVETVGLPNVNTQASSEIDTVEPLDEDTISHVSDKHGSSDSHSRTPTGRESGVKAPGITQTLAMRAFPSTFSASTEKSSPIERLRQGSGSTGTGDLLDVEQLSPTSARRRLESTGSSLVFPGGWVSSPAQKERASLEVAAGEFSRPVLEGTLKSPIVTPGVAETISEEKESRWRCIIM